MSLLVTGGAGFIGTNFVRYWRQRYRKAPLVILDALTYAGEHKNISDLIGNDFHFIEGNINDADLLEEILEKYRIEKIVHFAAESHVDRSIESPDIFLTTNVLGTHTLLKTTLSMSEKLKRKIHFHHVSTDEVYGSLSLDEPGFTEISRYAPNSPYSASKAASDHLVRAYYTTYNLPITITNCSNNYGPFQNPEKLIPLMIYNILQGKNLPVYGNGQNVRDWLYVIDHCEAIEQVLLKGEIGETYNIGGGKELSNIELVKLICHEIENKFKANRALHQFFPNAPCAHNRNNESLITFVPDRKGHDFRYAINSKKIQEKLGFRNQFDFATGLSLTIDWYVQKYMLEIKESLELKEYVE